LEEEENFDFDMNKAGDRQSLAKHLIDHYPDVRTFVKGYMAWYYPS